MRIVDVLFLGLLFHTLLPHTFALLFGCHPSCSTCLGPNSNQCLTCTSALLPVSGSCLCPDGSYPTAGLISCASCSSACGTCTGPTSTSCTGCNSGTFLYNSVCYTNCTSTQYFNITNLACATCDPACLTCSGPTNQQCASCISGTLNNGVCTCNSGQYKDSSYMCQTCDSTCKECSGSSSSQCTACNSGMILQSNQCKCSLGTYMSTNPVSCLSCNSMCQGCTGPATNQCTSCKNNMVLGSDGTCKCSSGTYLDTSSTSCRTCDTSCQECTGALNTQCSACKNNMQLVNGACGCSAGTYLDSGSMVCLPCYSSCQTCSGPNSNQCTSCDSSLTLISGQCKCTSGCTCPSGTYFDALSLTCLPCNAACVTCSGSAANQCLSCTSSQTLVNGVCKCSGSGCTCAAGTYFNSGTLDCDPCDSGCLTCDGASSSDCTSCKSNLQLSSKQCVCNPGTFLNTFVNTCIQCSSTCNTCSGATDNQCIDCKNNMQLLSTNQCGCGTGTFADLGSFTCVNCDGSCVECSGPDSSQCTQCTANKVLQNNYCLDICNANQYRASDGSCQTCTSPCATCSGAGTNQCKSCFSGDDLISGQCVSRCYSTCSACTGSSYSECNQCKSGYSFLESGNNIGQCLQECPNGYYATVSNGINVCLQKTAINNVLAYGSQVTQVIIMMGTDISVDYATIISGITISMTFISQQPQVYYPYTFQLSGDSQQIIIAFQFSGHLLPGNLLTINYDDFKDDNSTNFYLVNTQHQLKLLEYYQYSASTQAAINATSAANTAASQANGVFSVGSSLVVNSIHSMRSEIVQDMLAYFIYMNIDFPPNFIAFMSGGESPFQLIFPNLGSSIVQSLTSNDDEAAEKESSQDFNNALGKYAPDHSFMINNGFTLFAFVLFVGIMIVAELVRFSLRYVKKTKYPKFLNFLTRGFESASYALRWNFLVNQYIGVYNDMIFFGLLQIVNPPVFRAFVDYLQYTFGFIGLFSAFLGAVFMYVFTSKIFRILKKNKDVKEEDKNQNDANLLKRLGILYMTFYQDKRSRLNYPFLLLVRSFGFSLVLIFLQNYPLIQVLSVFLATILVIAYLVRFKPLSSKSQQILTIVYEGLFLVACIMALTLHIYNQNNLSNITVRSNLGFVLCACSLSMVILNFTSIIMELLKFREFLKLRKATTTQVKPLIADLSKANSEMPFKLIRNASILDNPDSTKRGVESWKEISFSQVPTVRDERKLVLPENNEEDNWLKDNVTPKEIKEMSPDLVVAKNLMELHGVYGGSNESMVFEKPLLPTNQLRKRQLFTKRTVQFDGSYDESRNIKLIQHIQEINVGRLRDPNSQDNNFFDYNKTRESSERNLKDRKKDLYKSVILKQRPQTVAKEKEKESGGESDGLFDLEGADPKYNYTNVPDEMSFSESLAWNDSRIDDKRPETFFKFRDDDEPPRSVEKRSNFRFDRWKEPNEKVGSSESQTSPIDSKSNVESKDSKESKEEEGKSEKEKSRFFIEITDVNIQTSSRLSSARTPPKRLLSRRHPEKEEVSPISTENDKNPSEIS